jgi:DNA repair protein RadC
VLAPARSILLRLAAARSVDSVSSPQLVREYLKTLLTSQEGELFVVIGLDNRCRVLASDVLFAGTIDGAAVYPAGGGQVGAAAQRCQSRTYLKTSN